MFANGSRPLTIGFDLSALDSAFKAHAQRGIGRYVRELKRYFEKHADLLPVHIEWFDYQNIRHLCPAALRAAHTLVEKLPALRTTVRQQLLYPAMLSGARKTAYHFPAHMDAPAWGMQRYAVTVLDLIPLVCADLYRATQLNLRYRFARFLEMQAIKNAALLLCISENTARDVHRILGVPWERLVVTPLGVDEKFFAVERVRGAGIEILRRYNTQAEINDQRPIILYVGGIDPRKNYGLMLASFKAVCDQRRDQGKAIPLLVVAGNIESDREYPKFKHIVKEIELNQQVIVTGYVSDEDLLKLYGMATVFFFPSLYEGFGLPPLEAMAAGVPVVSSNSSAMPEVLGEAAHTFDPTSREQAVRALLAVLDVPDRAQLLSEAGRKQARKFSWERTGDLTMVAYEKLCQGGSEFGNL